jgi:hypothetical protein
MSIKLITECTGKAKCPFFKSPETLLAAMEEKRDFKSLMMAMEIKKSWDRCADCPFKIKADDVKDGESFHNAICGLVSKPPFSMDAVSRGTGYSKTRVAQIEYSATRKLRRALGKHVEALDPV